MSQTLFLKDNKLFIRIKEGEFEVSNSKQFGSPDFIRETFDFANFIEWPGGVELIDEPIQESSSGFTGREIGVIGFNKETVDLQIKPRRKLARLLPEENKDTGAHSYTESAYTTVSSNTQTCGKFEIKSHYDFEPESAYKEVESSEPQEKWQWFKCQYCDGSGLIHRDSLSVVDVSAPSESQPHIFYGYLEEGVYGEFRHVPEPSPNNNKIGFIFGGKRYEFSRLAEPNKNKPESQEELWHSWEEGAILGKEVHVMLYDGSILKNCIPQTDGDFYYKPFVKFIDIAAVKQWKYSFENLYD